jgi:hypothetical protein
MCEPCKALDLESVDFFDQLRGIVQRHAFAIQAIHGSRTEAEFSYSIGLTAHGLPELIVTGLQQDKAARLIDVWGHYLINESLVLPGETMSCGPYALEAIEVERPQDHLLFAINLYGDAVRALQLAWADERGRWPWQSGHRARRAGQPLLGQRAPWYCAEHSPTRLDVPDHL